jgi:hypothetical protein
MTAVIDQPARRAAEYFAVPSAAVVAVAELDTPVGEVLVNWIFAPDRGAPSLSASAVTVAVAEQAASVRVRDTLDPVAAPAVPALRRVDASMAHADVTTARLRRVDFWEGEVAGIAVTVSPYARFSREAGHHHWHNARGDSQLRGPWAVVGRSAVSDAQCAG